MDHFPTTSLSYWSQVYCSNNRIWLSLEKCLRAICNGSHSSNSGSGRVIPDNPTDTVYNKDHWKKLVKVLRKHNMTVLSDEIYGSLNFSENHCSLAKFYPVCTKVSSGLLKWASVGGWRLGCHIYPTDPAPLKIDWPSLQVRSNVLTSFLVSSTSTPNGTYNAGQI